MDSPGLTLTIESARTGQEHVNLKDFLFQLSAFRKVLSSTESLIAKRKAVLDWQVVDLSHSSPAQVVLMPVHTQPNFTDVSKETVEKVRYYLDALSNEAAAPSEMDRSTLEAYQVFSNRVNSGVLKVNVGNGKSDIEVVGEVQRVIETILSPKTRAIGNVEGRLEYVNIHGNLNVFRIYPTIGSNKVECSFPSEILEDARKALGHRIRVFGELTYPERSDFPKTIKVDDIEQLPEDEDLPNLMDLRGAAPDLTGDLSSEEFVRRLRSDE